MVHDEHLGRVARQFADPVGDRAARIILDAAREGFVADGPAPAQPIARGAGRHCLRQCGQRRQGTPRRHRRSLHGERRLGRQPGERCGLRLPGVAAIRLVGEQACASIRCQIMRHEGFADRDAAVVMPPKGTEQFVDRALCQPPTAGEKNEEIAACDPGRCVAEFKVARLARDGDEAQVGPFQQRLQRIGKAAGDHDLDAFAGIMPDDRVQAVQQMLRRAGGRQDDRYGRTLACAFESRRKHAQCLGGETPAPSTPSRRQP